MNVKGLASLYDTAKGVGIHGQAGADMGEKKKGLPWWVGVSVIVIIAVLCFTIIPKLIARVFSPNIPPAIKKVDPGQPPVHAPAPATNPPPALPAVTPPAELKPELENTNRLYVSGYHRLFGYYTIMLSDGMEILEGDPKLQQIHPKKGVKYDGKYIPFARPEQGEYVMTQPPKVDYSEQPPLRFKVISPSGTTWVDSY